MTKKQIELVQVSWHLIKPLAATAGLEFYRKLFAAAPQVRPLFAADIRDQADKLVAMLGYVVRELHQLDTISDQIRKLGTKHHQYGARPEHYDVVGTCLIETLKQGLGDKWSQELEEAWVAAFAIVKKAMIEAPEMEQVID